MQKYQNNVQDTFGNAVTGVTVTVRTNPGGALATIYSDNGITPKSNPFNNDSDGELFFYAANGRYNIELSGAVSETKTDILLLDISTTGSTIDVIADINTATPPTTEAVTAQITYYDLAQDDILAQVGFNGSSAVRLANRMHGGVVQLNAEDSSGNAREMIEGDPDGSVTLRYPGQNVIRAVTLANGIFDVRSQTNADNEARQVRFSHQDGTERGQIGHLSGSSILQISNEINGSPVWIGANDAGGSARLLFAADPDTGVDIYGPSDQKRIGTQASGEASLYADGNTDTENMLLRFAHSNDTDRGWVGNTTDGSTRLASLVHGGGILITAEDSGGTQRTILTGDPDAVTTLRGDTDIQLLVNAGASNGIIIANGGACTFYWNAQANLRTSNEAASDIGMGAEVRHNDDSFYPVGMNSVPENSGLDTGNVTLGQSHVGKMLTYNSATARSLLFNNVAAIQLGAMFSLLVGPSAGTLTGDGGTGVQIRWWNGSGWTTTAAAGNITIGVGQYTIWKETDTLYWISGPTLS